MKTVQDLINEERERNNPKYDYIRVNRIYGGGVGHFNNPTNIIQDGEWLEFDTTLDIRATLPDIVPIIRHIKMAGVIVEFAEFRK